MGITTRLTLEKIKERLAIKVPHYEITSNYYYNVDTLLTCRCNLHKEIFDRKYTALERGQGCSKCATWKMKNNHPHKLNMEIAKARLAKANPNIIITSEEYENSTTNLDLKCIIDQHEWQANLSSIVDKNGNKVNGCPMCAGQVVCDKNRFSIIRPDLVKYFVNPEDAYNNTIYSGNIVPMKCPDCGHEKPMPISQLSTINKGFACPVCRDGASLPSKIVASLLTKLNVKFYDDVTTEWSNDKRYDFVLYDMNTIIEVHGDQHYHETSRKGERCRSLKEEQENDLYKERLANENGIANYIIINASKITFDKLNFQIIESLKEHFNMDDIDWTKLWIKAQSSKVVESWNLYNSGLNAYEIAKEIKMHWATVYLYLRLGQELGKVGEMLNRHSKKIDLFDSDMNFVKRFDSIRIAAKETETTESVISKSCRGVTKTVKDKNWRYVVD